MRATFGRDAAPLLLSVHIAGLLAFKYLDYSRRASKKKMIRRRGADEPGGNDLERKEYGDEEGEREGEFEVEVEGTRDHGERQDTWKQSPSD